MKQQLNTFSQKLFRKPVAISRKNNLIQNISDLHILLHKWTHGVLAHGVFTTKMDTWRFGTWCFYYINGHMAC